MMKKLTSYRFPVTVVNTTHISDYTNTTPAIPVPQRYLRGRHYRREREN